MIKLLTHLGLGDAIIQAGLIQKLGLRMPCKSHNYTSVSSFCDAFVTTDDLQYMAKGTPTSLGLGEFSQQRWVPGKTIWWEAFYRDAGLSFYDRFDWCPIYERSRNVKQAEAKEIFVANVGSDGAKQLCLDFLTTDNDRVLYPIDNGDSILRYADAIINADELHMIDSAFFHLAESLPLKSNQKRYLHAYAKDGLSHHWVRHEWTILTSKT